MLVDGLDYRAAVSKGAFTLPIARCYNTTVPITLTPYDLTAQQAGTSTTVSGSVGSINAGQLSACGITFSQFVSLNINGANYTITNPPDAFSYYGYGFTANSGANYIQLQCNVGQFHRNRSISIVCNNILAEFELRL